MRYALILDTETSGLPPENPDEPFDADCIEVGAIRFDLVLGAPVESYASLIRTRRSNTAAHINHITDAMLSAAPMAARVWKRVHLMAKKCDVVVSHRTDFDRKFVTERLRKMKPWACTKFEVEWPHGKPGDALVFLALAHGLGVSHVHRVMSDCDLISRLFSKIHEDDHDLVALLKEAMRPKPKFVALVEYNKRQLAKDAGFQWDGMKKQWWRKMDKKATKALPFEVTEAKES